MGRPKRIKITPSPEPMPYILDDDPEGTAFDELKTTGLTAKLLEELGAQVEFAGEDTDAEAQLLEDAILRGKVSPLRSSLPAALASLQFLKTYGERLAVDAAQVRTALTHKLLEIADCGDTKFELRAIELLGKHSDIGLFTERSEININYNSPEALEKAIKERVTRLLKADVIDEKPLGMDLDKELMIDDAEFEEIMGQDQELPDEEAADTADGLEDEDTDDWPEEWLDDDEPQPRRHT